jgi:hypothetical protein
MKQKTVGEPKTRGSIDGGSKPSWLSRKTYGIAMSRKIKEIIQINGSDLESATSLSPICLGESVCEKNKERYVG